MSFDYERSEVLRFHFDQVLMLDGFAFLGYGAFRDHDRTVEPSDILSAALSQYLPEKFNKDLFSQL